ncbi:uncharacterized protein LOC121429972 [Lytechinus variegatus]|uniref:uncharacterized protein LOC121429972 n=1 Tax=Lytechinus variegatus TaxID=7654 RepID=UPI001BB22A76|nr:uncharacterized protein LOC121429972 [Lytechinus variegatus]
MPTCATFRNVDALISTSALFLQTCYALGTIKSIGVYLPVLERDLGLTSTGIGICLGLFNAFGYGPGPVVAYLYQRLRGGFRRCLVMSGAVLATSGLVLGSFVTSGVELALCLSLAGLGSNILSLSLIITINYQSGDAFGIFYGIGNSGYAFGMALVPPLADYLMGIYGWRGSLLIIGGIMAHLIPLTLMVGLDIEGASNIELDNSLPKEQTTDGPVDTIAEETSLCFSGVQTTPLHRLNEAQAETKDVDNIASLEEFSAETSEDTSLIESSSTGKWDKDVSNKYNGHDGNGRYSQTICSKLYATGCRIVQDSIYYQDRLMIFLMFLSVVYAILNGGWYSFLIPRAVALIGKPSKALCIAYSGAVATFIGRCSSGILVGSKLCDGKYLFLFFTLLNITSLLVDTFVPKFPVMIVTSFITSLMIAERNVLLLVICKDRAHLSHFPVILASYQIAFGVGTFLGSSFAGYVADVAGTANASFMFIAAADSLVFCLMLPPVIVDRLQERSTG